MVSVNHSTGQVSNYLALVWFLVTFALLRILKYDFVKRQHVPRKMLAFLQSLICGNLNSTKFPRNLIGAKVLVVQYK